MWRPLFDLVKMNESLFWLIFCLFFFWTCNCAGGGADGCHTVVHGRGAWTRAGAGPLVTVGAGPGAGDL